MRCYLFVTLFVFSFIGAFAQKNSNNDKKDGYAKKHMGGEFFIVSGGTGFIPYKMNIPNELIQRAGGQLMGAKFSIYRNYFNSDNEDCDFFVGVNTVFKLPSYTFKRGFENAKENDIELQESKKRLIVSNFQWDIISASFSIKPFNMAKREKIPNIPAVLSLNVSPLTLYVGQLNAQFVEVKSANVKGIGFTADVSLTFDIYNWFK